MTESLVDYAEENSIVHASATIPDDPAFTGQWALNTIQAPEAWDTEKGKNSVVIAIIDTGCDFDHPDLAGKFTAGHDFVNNDSNPQDDHGHGTHVAGIAAAVTDNNIGMAGVSWYSTIMPVKVLDSDGSGTWGDAASGIIYAVDNGADVINMSLGGSSPSATVEDAVRYAYLKGVTVVVATGNDNGPVSYPAAYDNYVIGVAATDSSDSRASFSNYGQEVDVAAPGVNIYSTLWNDTYASWSGTSMATPHVAGLAALLLAQDPTLTPDEVKKKIKDSSDDVNSGTYPGEDNYLGAGRINAYKAVSTPFSPPPTVDATTEFAYDKNGNMTKKTEKRDGNTDVTTYSYDFENRLVEITYPDGTTSQYDYDGLGKRIMSDEQGEVTRYQYDGLNAIIERNASGTTMATYTRGLGYGGGIGSIISVLRGSDATYYHYNGIGAVTEITDTAQDVVQSYVYDAYGNVIKANGSLTNPYQFSTKEYGYKSGLIYFGARYYDPRIGRWITKDPLGFIDGPNLYAFSKNDPINWIDWMGLDAVVLNDSDGAYGFGHNGIAIGNDSTGWDYYSQDGSKAGGGHHIHYNSFNDLMVAQGGRYDRSYRIETDSIQDQQMRESANSNLNNPYDANPIGGHYQCADFVNDALRGGGIDVGDEGWANIANDAFNNIRQANPSSEK